MCTQELIWCSCGHGEFLEIKKCRTGHLTGRCWTVVHGNHHLVVPAACSYCQSGLNKKKPLGSPRPRDELAKKVEANQDVELGKMLEEGLLEEAKWLEECAGDGAFSSLEDVLSTDWSGFDLERDVDVDLWNLDPGLVEGGALGSIPEEDAQ
ncbi:hypothetical protein M409DRAFT_56253 [Zasmidium cellare ATCC 36951]|uniref:Uncharacterized protein n=1 Tax=Zasmidium cellare ATCC 36951 TaxID=1080233 RepID=A0A6A6CHK8_ZASCE|nr:uncharacterized protein M409DRAFT_56253 [Zasmidium cellare ATCC 36951]KAF2164896.1 hypothetical protein M409DRAFT_56253 [Zasmidium cellare ATCC 36951]